MNGEDRKRISLAHISKARQFLDSAGILMKHGMIDSAINRAYYSAFHAVEALLVFNGLATKTHKGALNLFYLHFVETGHVSQEINRKLNRLFSLRMDADYGFISTLLTENDVLMGIEIAKQLIEFAENWIVTA